MDEIEIDLLKNYADQLKYIVNHLIDNKAINDVDKGMLLLVAGSDIFKAGFCHYEQLETSAVERHAMTLVPPDYTDEVSSLLSKLAEISAMQLMSDEPCPKRREKLAAAFAVAKKKSKAIRI